jgi:y4mF family transcriptional regulator
MVVDMRNHSNAPVVPIPSAAILGNHIRAARLRKGFTQRDLAKKIHCSLRWIAEVENGKDTARIGKVLLLCQFLDLKVLIEYPNGVYKADGDGGAGTDYPDLDTIMEGQL